MTEEQIFLVFNKNGCVAAPCGVNATEWYLSETDSSWNDKIGVVLPGIKKVIFGSVIKFGNPFDGNNFISFNDLTPELIEEKINLVRKKEKLIKINERIKDLEKDFVKV